MAISNSIIRRNQAPGRSEGNLGRGGGIYAGTEYGNSTLTLTVINSLIYKNQANWSGGGIEINAGEIGSNNVTQVTVINSTLTGNESDMHNKGFEMGGGIRVFAYDGNGAIASLDLYNSILYGNTTKGDTLPQDLYVSEGSLGQASAHASHCDINTIEGNLILYHPVNVINSDPLFADPDHDDYHLTGNSPCINAGTGSVPSPGLPTTDFEGDPRTFGPAPDIGADEVLPVSPDEGTIGTVIYITGSGFGTKKGKVQIGDVALKVMKWTDGYIQASLSKALIPGTYNVTVFPKGSSPIIFPNSFDVRSPEIESVFPNVEATNGEIILRGFFFGTKKGKVTIAGINCKVLKWTMVPSTGQSEVRFLLPKGLGSGGHELKITNDLGSDTTIFTIL